MYKRYLSVLIAMILLTPLGLLAKGTAWREWGVEELSQIIGFLPQGLVQTKAPQAFLPDYSLIGLYQFEIGSSIGYIISVRLGTILIYTAVILLCKLTVKGNKKVLGIIRQHHDC